MTQWIGWKESRWTIIQSVAAAAVAVVTLLALTGITTVRTKERARIVTAEITAHVPGTHFEVWDEQGLDLFEAPQVPAESAIYTLGDLVSCPAGYVADDAWHEITGSWPSIDVMYTVNAGIVNGVPNIELRTRQGFMRGYAYIDVIVQCVQK